MSEIKNQRAQFRAKLHLTPLKGCSTGPASRLQHVLHLFPPLPSCLSRKYSVVGIRIMLLSTTVEDETDKDLWERAWMSLFSQDERRMWWRSFHDVLGDSGLWVVFPSAKGGISLSSMLVVPAWVKVWGHGPSEETRFSSLTVTWGSWDLSFYSFQVRLKVMLQCPPWKLGEPPSTELSCKAVCLQLQLHGLGSCHVKPCSLPSISVASV